jgi:hypothetical protein
MSVDKNYNISQLIAEQFPDIYNEDGPLLVAFVKSYYEWMETQGPLYHSRRLLEYTDIDQTVEQFIVHFKETYLKNIQLDTATNIPQLVKHSLDLYRSKGTQRAIELFFRLVFAEPAEVYYPSTDVFILSDGDWVVPTYLEITASSLNGSLVGQQITGINSGATAFVEKLIRKSNNSRYSEILMISSINGTFSAGELLRLSKNSAILPGYPFVRGSLSSLFITDGGTNHAVGDTVDIISTTGSGARARVSSIESLTGQVSFTLNNGGWGYSTSNASIIVTEQILRLSDLTLSTTDNSSVFSTATRTVTQPKANIAFANATVLYNPGDSIFTYYANGVTKGVGTVMSTQTSNSSVGTLFITVNSGNLQSNVFYTAANVATANQTLYTDETATGIVYGQSSNVSLYYSNAVGTIAKTNTISQMNDYGQIFVTADVFSVTPNTSIDGTIKVDNLSGLFLTNKAIFTSNGFSANVSEVQLDWGVANVSGTWTDLPYNIIYDSLSTSSGTVSTVTRGDSGSFNYTPNLSYVEYVNLNNDLLAPYANVALNAATYGSGLESANLSTIMDSALHYANLALGQITSLDHLNPGENYNYPPFTRIDENIVSQYDKHNFILTINNATGVFAVGELLRQGSTTAQGIVTSANTSVVHCTRMNFNDQWIATTNTSNMLVGVASGFTANVVNIAADPLSGIIGENAVVTAAVTSSNTSVKELQVIDSGFNYSDGEFIEFTDGLNSGMAIASVQTQGASLGYSRSTSSLLSADKFLADGLYYQDFSYEIRSPVTLDRYEEMLKKLLHVAGTKYFTAFNKSTIIEAALTADCAITISGGVIITPLSASISPTSQIITRSGAGPVNASASILATGGIAPYSYLVNGGGLTVTGGTTANPSFSTTLFADQDLTFNISVTITDSIGSTPVTANASIEFIANTVVPPLSGTPMGLLLSLTTTGSGNSAPVSNTSGQPMGLTLVLTNP